MSVVGKPVTTSVLAAAALTTMFGSDPVMPAISASVTVIDCVPAVSSAIEKRCSPASSSVKVYSAGSTAWPSLLEKTTVPT